MNCATCHWSRYIDGQAEEPDVFICECEDSAFFGKAVAANMGCWFWVCFDDTAYEWADLDGIDNEDIE